MSDEQYLHTSMPMGPIDDTRSTQNDTPHDFHYVDYTHNGVFLTCKIMDINKNSDIVSVYDSIPINVLINKILKHEILVQDDNIYFSTDKQYEFYCDILITTLFCTGQNTVSIIQCLIQNGFDITSSDYIFCAIGYDKDLFDFLLKNNIKILISHIVHSIKCYVNDNYYYFYKLIELFDDKENAVVKTINMLGGIQSKKIKKTLKLLVNSGINLNSSPKIIINLLDLLDSFEEKYLEEIEKILNYIVNNKYDINEIILME